MVEVMAQDNRVDADRDVIQAPVSLVAQAEAQVVDVVLVGIGEHRGGFGIFKYRSFIYITL